ncbi:MAG: ATP-binding protein [bacterium]|nr:ATP-binding protein [bacterium]
MRLTKSELLEKVRLGEDSYFELKEVRFAGSRITGPDQKPLADELAAFANLQGGVLLLGADDKTREVVGIPLDKLDAVEDLLRQACHDSITPPLNALIERTTLPDSAGRDQPVIVVEILRSLFVHQSPSGYLWRAGSSKRPIPPDNLASLFQQRSQTRLIRFDEQVVAGASLEELEPSLCDRFASDLSRDERPDLLRKLAMAREDDDGVLRPTVAGLLMGSRDSIRHLPNAFIQAVAYRGTSVAQAGSAYQLDARDITGPLDEQIFATCGFVDKNMSIGAVKRNGGREDRPQFDALAVFEAVTNAVAHRDYSMAGSKIRLRLFADRLEIYSPGAIPNTMTVDSLPYRQAARNEALTSLLARCPVRPLGAGATQPRSHIMDKRGEGVPILLARSQELSGRRPEYRMIDDSELLLTIFGTPTEDPHT